MACQANILSIDIHLIDCQACFYLKNTFVNIVVRPYGFSSLIIIFKQSILNIILHINKSKKSRKQTLKHNKNKKEITVEIQLMEKDR